MNQEIEKLINIAAKGEKVTERQREIIRNKAIAIGEDADEAELMLDLSLKSQNTSIVKSSIHKSKSPIQKVSKKTNDVEVIACAESVAPQKTADKPKQKNRITAAILAITLGTFGGHHFYLGKIEKGITCILFCWTGVPTFIGFVASLKYLLESDKKFRDSIN